MAKKLSKRSMSGGTGFEDNVITALTLGTLFNNDGKFKADATMPDIVKTKTAFIAFITTYLGEDDNISVANQKKLVLLLSRTQIEETANIINIGDGGIVTARNGNGLLMCGITLNPENKDCVS